MKRPILFIFMVILMSSIVIAATGDIVYQDNFDVSINTTFWESNIGSPTINTTFFRNGLGSIMQRNGGADLIRHLSTTSPLLNTTTVTCRVYQFINGCNITQNSFADQGILSGMGYPAENSYLVTRHNAPADADKNKWHFGDTFQPSSIVVANTSWTELTATSFTNGTIIYYVNKTVVGTDTNIPTRGHVSLGPASTPSACPTHYDDFFCWEGNIDNEPTFPVVVTLLTPAHNRTTNINPNNFTFNVSSNFPIANCSLWSNFSGTWEINTSNTSRIINATINNFTDVDVPDGDYIWNVACNNTFFATSNFTLRIDTVDPVLVTDFVSGTNFTNNITGQFNFSDNNLIFSVNFTILEENIILFNRTDINASTFTHNLQNSIRDLSAGVKTLSVIYADSHTAKKLKDKENYNPSNGLFNDYIRYDFDGKYNPGFIKISNKEGSILDNWETESQTDRYIFRFTPNSKNTQYTFVVEAKEKIHILQNKNTKYNKWLIYDGHWVDFYPYTNIEIKRILNNKVEVTIKDVPINKDIIEFNSIGDLNIVQQNFTFNAQTNITDVFDLTIADNTETELFLEFSGTGHAVPNLVILEWNGTNHTATKTIDTPTLLQYRQNVTPRFNLNLINISTNVSHRWYYNISVMNSLNITNQTVLFTAIDNCTIFDVASVNFTIREEDNDNLVMAKLSGFFELFVNGVNLIDFNLTWSRNYTQTICINPLTSNYSIDAQLEYENNTYATKTYYFDNATITSDTQQIELFFTPNSSIVTFTVKDQNDDPVPNVFINVLKYDFATNTHKISEIIKTDTAGEALGNIKLDTEWYKFFLILDGQLLLDTEPAKITLTSKTFRINLLSDFYTTFNQFRQVTGDVSFTNSTRNFVYSFVNPTGTSVEACLEILELNSSGVTTLNESCTTAPAGSILINIGNSTEVSERTFIGKGFVQFSSSDERSKFIIDQEDRSFVTGFKNFGLDGVFISFMARIVVALIGIWSPIAAIIGLLSIDIGMFAMGLYFFSPSVLWGYIIMAIIVLIKVSRR